MANPTAEPSVERASLLTCADCGKPMRQKERSLPQGQARCHPCRRANPQRAQRATLHDAVLCAGTCGRMIGGGRTSLPAGERMCRPCRRVRRLQMPEELMLNGRRCSHCKSVFQPANHGQRFCSRRCKELVLGPTVKRRRPDTRRKPSTTARGYGSAHQRERKRWAPHVAAGLVTCWRCGRRILPGQLWDLGHDDHDRGVYRGPEHPYCNRAAGGRKANSRRRVGTNPSRRW